MEDAPSWKRSRRPRAELAAPEEFVRDTASMQRNAELRSPDGRQAAEAVLLPDGRGYLLRTQLPALASYSSAPSIAM